jgi:tyrosinase
LEAGTGVPTGGTRAPNRLRHRKSVHQLTAQQLGWWRDGIRAMSVFSDDRGLSYWASLHGGPPRQWCHHGNFDGRGIFHGAPLFLPWHRAYLYFFELALQEQTRQARVPWWDWTSAEARREGLPRAFAEREVDGQANPLFSQPILRGGGRRDRLPERTGRDPGPPQGLPDPRRVAQILRRSNFLDFSGELENVHGQIHGWAGGAMTSVPTAAFDPIFWSHHAMIDRLWRLWQLRNPENAALWRYRNVALAPFEMTVGETLEVTLLGYDYAGSTTSVDVRP